MSRSNRVVFRATLVIVSLVIVALFVIVTSQTSVANRTLYTGQEHHQVTMSQAERWTSTFQKTAGDEQLIAGYFGRNIFDKILNQEGVSGIRIYKAAHDNGAEVMVLVGVDGKGNDIAGGIVGENIMPCPPFCGGDKTFQAGVTSRPLASSK